MDVINHGGSGLGLDCISSHALECDTEIQFPSPGDGSVLPLGPALSHVRAREGIMTKDTW